MQTDACLNGNDPGFLVAGCSSRTLRNVYLFSLSYDNPSTAQTAPLLQLNAPFLADVRNMSDDTSLEIRVGYFGLCMRQKLDDWLCVKDANSLAETLNASHDPLNLVWIATSFQARVVLAVLIIISIVFQLFILTWFFTFPGWHEEQDDENDSLHEVKPFPSQIATYSCFALATLSSLFLLIAILWQHVAAATQSSTVETVFKGVVKARVGAPSMALGWVAVVLISLQALGVLIMILSIHVLRRLSDSSDSGDEEGSDSSDSGDEEGSDSDSDSQ
ncbi:hypothetical protein AJ80_08303 [Polytolypa hystricis UAMH7299]|uniref:Uncharacterized protein n=1 Tax=Polytolypa hystricis (strain UAMH7299) TaxID=1447883 RepID=A0A2B7XA19_POLH7|nr:hypothetical protein AJ80_08303 [Polytolypa hystricis UAMH7299]